MYQEYVIQRGTKIRSGRPSRFIVISRVGDYASYVTKPAQLWFVAVQIPCRTWMPSSSRICIESTILGLALKRPARRLHVRDGRELASRVILAHHLECQAVRCAFPSDHNEWNFYDPASVRTIERTVFSGSTITICVTRHLKLTSLTTLLFFFLERVTSTLDRSWGKEEDQDLDNVRGIGRNKYTGWFVIGEHSIEGWSRSSKITTGG